MIGVSPEGRPPGHRHPTRKRIARWYENRQAAACRPECQEGARFRVLGPSALKERRLHRERTNRTQEAWVYSFNEPIRRKKREYIPVTDQSDAGRVGIFPLRTNQILDGRCAPPLGVSRSDPRDGLEERQSEKIEQIEHFKQIQQISWLEDASRVRFEGVGFREAGHFT
eukprot:9345594-Pyramimonas_sp.AAC.1